MTDKAAAPAPTPPACAPAPLEVRAAQALVVGLPGVTSAQDPLIAELAELGVGGVMISKVNVRDEEQVKTLIAGLRQRFARKLLVTTDEESGRVSSFSAVIGRSPSARTLAATRDPAGVQRFARELGGRLAALGVDADLAPVADVFDGPAGGVLGDRAFSGDPDRAGRYSLAFTTGLIEGGIKPAVKHFPGQGRSPGDSHKELSRVATSVEELRRTDVAAFVPHIQAGVPMVMLGHVIYEALDAGLPATLSPSAYRLLREMGFKGVAMTDSLGMGSINLRWGFAEGAVLAVLAGADAVLATDGHEARSMRDAIVAAVRSGRIPEARVSEAAGRMATLKGEDPRAIAC